MAVVYAEVFGEEGALDRLEAFVSLNGAKQPALVEGGDRRRNRKISCMA